LNSDAMAAIRTPPRPINGLISTKSPTLYTLIWRTNLY
jgi:hypothetical protein